MGEEKAPKGGGGKDAPEPVVLRMYLHCKGCASKVQKCIQHMPGVESVVTELERGRIIVLGTADAAALKARIEAKTKKPVDIISAGEKKVDKEDSQPKKEEKAEEKEKQPPEEKKPKEETVLLKIRLHCDGCAYRIRHRIYKIKGVRDVVLDGSGKDEVKVIGTMDVAAMLAYLEEKLKRSVEAVAPGKKDAGSGNDKKDGGGKGNGGGDGDKKKESAAVGARDKGKGIEVAGPPTAAAAASMAPPPAEASTYHVSPYGHVAYPQGPPPSYYHYNGGNADGVGYAYANPNSAAAGSSYYPYHHGNPDHQPYPPPPYPYRFDMAPAPQLFSDENPNACSVM